MLKSVGMMLSVLLWGHVCLVVAATDVQAQQTGSVKRAVNASGLWLTSDGRAQIRIKQCGSGLCNKIVWLKNPRDKNGEMITDRRNQNPKLRSRPILGSSILLGMAKNGDGTWKGRVYDPKRGRIFKAMVKVLSPNKLLVKGCVAWNSVCREKIWRRVGRRAKSIYARAD